VQQSGSSAEVAGQAANGIDHAIGNLALSGRDHEGALEHRRLRRSAIAESPQRRTLRFASPDTRSISCFNIATAAESAPLSKVDLRILTKMSLVRTAAGLAG